MRTVVKHILLIFLLSYSASSMADAIVQPECVNKDQKNMRTAMPAEHINWDVQDDSGQIYAIEVSVSSVINDVIFQRANVVVPDSQNFKFGFSLEARDMTDFDGTHKIAIVAEEGSLNDFQLLFSYEHPSNECISYIYIAGYPHDD